MSTTIDFKKLSDFVEKNNLFQSTQDMLKICLKNSWDDNRDTFLEDFGNDLETVFTKYKFENNTFTFSTSYACEPPMDYISIRIEIYDEENNYICRYTTFYDTALEGFDDKLD